MEANEHHHLRQIFDIFIPSNNGNGDPLHAVKIHLRIIYGLLIILAGLDISSIIVFSPAIENNNRSPVTAATLKPRITGKATTPKPPPNFNLFCAPKERELVRALSSDDSQDPRFVAVCLGSSRTMAFMRGKRVLLEMAFSDLKNYVNGDIFSGNGNNTTNSTLVYLKLNFNLSLNANDYAVLQSVAGMIL